MIATDLAASPRAASDAVTAEWRRRLMLVVLPALAVFAFAIATQSVFTDGDTNWQVAAGRWILAHRAVPRVDPFSYTFAGHRWVAHEWGAEVLLSGAFQLAGWGGVMLITGLAAALATAIVALAIVPRLGTLSVIASLGLAFALLEPLLLARPHVIAWPLLALWLALLIRARERDAAPPAWLVPVMLVWANLHGSYVFGLAFTGFFGLEAVLAAPGRRLAVAARWAGLLAAATLAAAVTPNGIDGLLFPIRVMLMTSLNDIGEWKPVNFAWPTPFEIALLLTLFVFVYRGVRMGAVRLLLLLVLLHMALQHFRQEAVLAIAAPLLVAEPLGRALEAERADAPPPGAPPLAEIFPPLAVAALLFLGFAAWRLARPVVRVDRATVPVTALAHVPPGLAAQPVLNDYSFGGWLVFNRLPVFIDGRADMYGDAFVRNYMAVEEYAQPAAVQATLAKWRIAWTILKPSSPLVAYLDRLPGWRRIYADKWAVVQARDSAWPPSAAPETP